MKTTLPLLTAFLSVLLTGHGILSAADPSIIWASDPVRPGETVVVRGDSFGESPGVEISGLQTGSWIPAKISQHTDRTLKFELPPDWQPGPFRFRISTDGGRSKSAESIVNSPTVWWMQGDDDHAATPGGWVRLFGLNLNAGNGVSLALSNGADSSPLTLYPVDDYNLRAEIPSSLKPGNYTVALNSGTGSKIPLGSLEIVAPPKAGKVFNVLDYGAVPGFPDSIQYFSGMKAPDQVDSTASIQKALDAAGTAGGGVVVLPRGVFVLSKGITVPANVTLRGAGKALTALSWIDEDEPREKQELSKLTWGSLLYKAVKEPGSSPHPFLIGGPGHFTVEDMAIYAFNHQAGILSDYPDTAPTAGHVKVRRVVLRLNRFLNVQENNRHYTNAEEIYLKRIKEEPQRCATWQGAIHLSGPDLEITDCDIYSSLSAIVLNGASGVIARNRIAAVPKQWSVLSRGTHRMIFEQNECLNGGISILNVHHVASRDSKSNRQSNSSREIYCARNSVKDCYLKDRDGGFVSDFHAPVGIYAGWAKSSTLNQTTLSEILPGDDLSGKWAGSMVSILDGKGAGQIRFMKSLQGDQLEVDAPWQITPDNTSFLAIHKALYRVLFIGNSVSDAGNAVSLWGGGVEVVVANNRSDRGGSFNQITLCHGDQVMPCLRAQFLDNVIAEGIGWGAAYVFPRGSLIGTYTYTPLSFERVIQKNKGQQVTAPDYSGPLAMDQIFRRNRIENNGCFYAGGVVSDVLFEKGSVAHSRVGVDIRSTGGRWDDALFHVGPTDILIRGNVMDDVTVPYGGDFLKNAKVIPYGSINFIK